MSKNTANQKGINHIHSYVSYEGAGYDYSHGRGALSAKAEENRAVAGSEGWEHKIIVIGKAGVGKTSLLTRVVKGGFSENYKASVGVDFEFLQYSVFGIPCTLNCWDTAGEERYQSVFKRFYTGAVAAILVFDINCENSFEDLQTKWLPAVREAVNPDTPILLIANKCDLIHYVDESKIISFAKEQKLEYYKCSVLDDCILGVASRNRVPCSYLFERLAVIVTENRLETASETIKETSDSRTVSLNSKGKGNKTASTGRFNKPSCCK